MTLSIKRLGPGDEAILDQLALDEADFDLAGRGTAQQPLDPAAARRYLANPAVLHWVAFDGELAVGDLYCVIIPLSADAGSELLLYDIGVREAWRRRGVGRALTAVMEQWMVENEVNDVWVLADNPGAVEFYRACGFAIEQDVPTYLTRQLVADDE